MRTVVPRRAASSLAAPRWSIPPQAPVATALSRLSAQRGEHLLRGTARQRALAHDVPASLGAVVAQVDHRRGRAGQLAAVEHEVGAVAQVARARPRARARRARRRGWRWTAAAGAARRRAPRAAGQPRHAQAERATGPAAQARAGSARSRLGSSSVTAPGSSASSAARSRRSSSGSAPSARSSVEEHDRGRALPAGGP